MEKTVIVAVETTTRHRIYHKIFKRTKRYMAHDDRLGAKPGDQVRILETRPLSRHKRWRVAEVIQRGEVAEVQPKEIDADLIERPREQPAETSVAESPAIEAPTAEAAADVPQAAVETPEEAPAEGSAPEAAAGGPAVVDEAEGQAAAEGSESLDSPESPEEADGDDRENGS
jgi:small subunit ribosomal protein S17